MIRDNDAADALAAAVGVEGVGLLLDVLALARLCALGDGLGKEGHELADAGAGEARVLGEVLFGDKLGRLVLAALVTDDLWEEECQYSIEEGVLLSSVVSRDVC